MLNNEQLSFWNENGYLVLPSYVSTDRIDMLNDLVESMYANPPHYLVADSTSTNLRARLADMPMPLREARMLKLNDLYLEHAAIRELATSEDLSNILAQLLGEPAVLCNSLNFEKGSQQSAHIDSLYMTPLTPGKLVAIWVALEDSRPDAGQLFYFPGSHKISLYKFSDGSHHANPEEAPLWRKYIEQQLIAHGCAREQFSARKGDLFIWHANLLHGGSAINDSTLTRKSLVCHYFGLKDARRAGFECVHEGENAYWICRGHAPIPGANPVPRLAGKVLQRLGLYRRFKNLLG